MIRVRILNAISFLLLSACTQLPPPHSSLNSQGLQGGGSPLNQVQHSPDPLIRPTIEPSHLELQFLSADRLILVIKGVDAAKIDRLLGILAESDSEHSHRFLKQGRDFSCVSERGIQYACTFEIGLPKGEVRLAREVSELKSAPPEALQSFEDGDYLRIEGPEKPGKIRLQILDGFAEQIFNRLMPDQVFDLVPDQTHGAGVRKMGEQVDCWMTTLVGAPEAKSFACYLYLDVRTGVIDNKDSYRVP